VITFKSTDDLSKLPRTDPAFPIVEDLVKRLITDYISEGYDYRPEDDGYTILVEPEDADRELTELWPGCRLTNIYWEGITQRDGFFIAIYLANNEYGLCFVIPDAPWVNGELREVIEMNLDP
jgi:hypothetical protein